MSRVDTISITCTAPVNIAVIKYWGKRDEKLILPINSSLSACLHQKDLKTITTAVASRDFKEDEIWLNGKKEDINNKRIQQCLKELRARATKFVDKSGNVLISNKDEWSQYKLKIVSENNFPTAAGLASSASGYACLVYTVAQLLGVQGDVSSVARMGSGSACRSMYGGWVKWEVGTKDDGSDSVAIQVKPEDYWPQMRILVFVVNDQQKETSSTDGMQQSVKTSEKLAHRAKHVVPQRMIEMEKAIENRDYSTFGDLTMKDSDDFHDVCADTKPPIYYMNAISKSVVHLINCYNQFLGQIKAAYTFDAGPNAVIYLLEEHVVPIVALALHYFPPVKTQLEQFVKNEELLKKAKEYQIPDDLKKLISRDPTSDALKYILFTEVGPGPQVADPGMSLVDPFTGLPKNIKQ